MNCEELDLQVHGPVLFIVSLFHVHVCGPMFTEYQTDFPAFTLLAKISQQDFVSVWVQHLELYVEAKHDDV